MNENIAKIEAKVNETNGSIEVNFVSSEAGIYTITPKLGEITGNAISVTIEENTEINKITLGTIEGNFRIEQTQTIPVQFFHIYETENSTEINEEVEVKASKL